jgi:hypothetical protein
VEQILIDAGLNENQILSFELKLQLTGTTKNGAFMECNFLEKSPEEFVELFYSDCFPQ